MLSLKSACTDSLTVQPCPAGILGQMLLGRLTSSRIGTHNRRRVIWHAYVVAMIDVNNIHEATERMRPHEFYILLPLLRPRLRL